MIYKATKGVLKVILENCNDNSATFSKHEKRKTVTAINDVYALKSKKLGYS